MSRIAMTTLTVTDAAPRSWGRIFITYTRYTTIRMHTTVRIAPKDKHKLERLRAELSRRLGRPLTQQESLAFLLSHADKNVRRVVAELLAPDFPFTKKQIERLEKMRRPWGKAVLDEGVDEIVYG